MLASKFRSWLVLACIYLSLLAVGQGMQCTVHADNSCKATCNGTIFDISKVFDYPVNVSGFLWDPCKPVECPDAFHTTNVAVCQKADQFYNCGLLKEPIWLFNYDYQDIMFTIQYPWGTDWRISEISFAVEESMPKPQIRFIAEKPHLQYNFEVRGKCVGQPFNGCT